MKKILLALLVTCASVANATDYYVATTGNDSWDGLSPVYTSGTNGPFLSSQTGVNAAAAGDTVFWMDGTYTVADGDNIRFAQQGTASQKITYKSYTKHGAHISAGIGTGARDAPISIGIYSGDWLKRQPMHIVIDGFEITGGEIHNIQSSGGSYVEIKNCLLHDSGRDPLKFNSGADYAWIHNNEIYNSGQADAGCPLACNSDGIDITSSHFVKIHDNYIHDIKSWGLYLKKGSHNGEVYRNFLETCEEGGISLGESSVVYDSVAHDNILYDITDTPLSVSGGKNVQFYNNTCYDVCSSNSDTWGAIRISAAQGNNGAEFTVNFNSGGTAELEEGDEVIGATSGSVGVVWELTLVSGTWTGGDATGYFTLEETKADSEYLPFRDGIENINVTAKQSNICTTTGDSTEDDKYSRDVVFQNNIVVLASENTVHRGFVTTSSPFAEASPESLDNLTLNNNIYYYLGGSTAMTYIWLGYLPNARTLSEWQAWTDTNGYPQSDSDIMDNPDFVSTTSTNDNFLKIQAVSPAIGAGVTTSYTTDYAGETRTVPFDIGAYEYTDIPTAIGMSLSGISKQ